MQIAYTADADVDATIDAELRGLLSSCFTGDANERFRHQRFYHEVPAHRWLARDSEGRLVAHLALHDKTIGTSTGNLRVGGIAEVCVAESQRGQGLVRRLIAVSDEWMIQHDLPFGTLFGDPRIYGSSGYRAVDNSLHHLSPDARTWLTESVSNFLIKPLGIVDWPGGEIDLRGPKF